MGSELSRKDVNLSIKSHSSCSISISSGYDDKNKVVITQKEDNNNSSNNKNKVVRIQKEDNNKNKVVPPSYKQKKESEDEEESESEDVSHISELSHKDVNLSTKSYKEL